MWQAIRAALRALTDALSRTTSAFGQTLWWLDEHITRTWNWLARSASGTNYRPAPVTELRDQVADMTVEPAAPAPDRDDLADLGRRMKLGAQAMLDGAAEAPHDVPADLQIWLMARTLYDLTLVTRATDVEVGRHFTGECGLRGPHGYAVPTIDTARDEKIIMIAMERTKPRVVPEWEKQAIRDAFGATKDRSHIEPVDEPDPLPVVGRKLAPGY